MQNMNLKLIAAGAGFLVILALGIHLLSGTEDNMPTTAPAAAVNPDSANKEEPPKTEVSVEMRRGTPPVAENEAEAEEMDRNRPGADLTYMQEPDFDPEAQPRTFWMKDFQELRELPDGYTGEGVRMTERGIELAPLAEGEEPGPRSGTVVSKAELMDFEYNGIVPMWRHQAPDGTALVYEISASPDGDNWTEWKTLEPVHDEVSPTYPDGSPNPNYGFTPAGVQMGGMQLWNFVRYRATLYSENAKTPTLEAMRLYVMDSTFGQGVLAEVVTEDEDGEATQ